MKRKHTVFLSDRQITLFRTGLEAAVAKGDPRAAELLRWFNELFVKNGTPVTLTPTNKGGAR